MDAKVPRQTLVAVSDLSAPIVVIVPSRLPSTVHALAISATSVPFTALATVKWPRVTGLAERSAT
jgi:hypothetical protein